VTTRRQRRNLAHPFIEIGRTRRFFPQPKPANQFSARTLTPDDTPLFYHCAFQTHAVGICRSAARIQNRGRHRRPAHTAFPCQSPFSRQTLPNGLSSFQIGYTHIAELGGLRGEQPRVGPPRNLFWRVQAFQSYADYALAQQFHAGLDRLRELGRVRRAP
jgi:hypothetical protein